MKDVTQYQRKLQREYLRARRFLIQKLSKSQTPSNAKALIREAIKTLTARQSRIIAYCTAKSFLMGRRDARKEIKGVKMIRGAAPSPRAGIGFDLSSIDDSDLRKITRSNIGAIGKFNIVLRDDLTKEYNKLLSDNKLLNSLNTHGWTPWLDETLRKRGIDPAVISLVKHQKTTAKMLTILNDHGMRGGMHPDQVARRLVPYINRYFGPGGVTIDNVGKTVRRFTVDADGNYKWVDHIVTRKYHATTRTYSRLIARNSMTEARRDAYYSSLQKTNLVDHYISVSVLDARTCGNCAMMHGQIVTKEDGPSYHGNCHCDLRPVWKRNSVLADKNKPALFYERQRDVHFIRMNDLKLFNNTMPAGSKLKNYALLPDNALSRFIPGPLQMRPIRHALMGEPAKAATPPPRKIGHMSDEELRSEADKLFAKTKKDGVEHLNIYTVDGTVNEFKGSAYEVAWTPPKGNFTSLHTHPSEWDSPLSEQDFVSFLTNKGEKVMAATSSKNIYVVTKGDNYKFVTMREEKFLNEFKSEIKKVLPKKKKLKYIDSDYHDAYLEAGKIIAKRYTIEYKVIPR